MKNDVNYNDILSSYPEFITKDQMYRICHISKKTCLYLLESGLVPCVDTGKLTHRFIIRTADVVDYLAKRKISPKSYQAPVGYYGTKKVKPGIRYTEEDVKHIRPFYENLLSDYPEVMSTADVASFTGYEKQSVLRWCSKGYLKSLFVRQKVKIPKEYLIDFLLTDHFLSISVQSKRHRWFNEQIQKLMGTTHKNTDCTYV